MQKPTKEACNAAKGVLRYLKRTADFHISYKKRGNGQIFGFSDSNWGQERPERKSVRGFVYKFSGGFISWRSKKQSVVAQSSVEAEYISLADSVREALWLKKFGNPVGIQQSTFNISIGEEKQGCRELCGDRVVNEKSKHIVVRYQMIVDNILKTILQVHYVRRTEMLSDIMTKVLHKPTSEELRL